MGPTCQQVTAELPNWMSFSRHSQARMEHFYLEEIAHISHRDKELASPASVKCDSNVKWDKRVSTKSRQERGRLLKEREREEAKGEKIGW